MLTFIGLVFVGVFATSEASVGLVPLTADVANMVLRIAAPGVDFPILSEVPKTDFTCFRPDIVAGHYYADPETGCQVFHVCDRNEIIGSYLCPNYTIFNDQTEVCEWFHQVDCAGKGKPIVVSKPLIPAVVAKPMTNPRIVAVLQPQTYAQELPASPFVASNAYRVFGFPNIDASLVSGVKIPLSGTSRWKSNILRGPSF